ncbi:MAG: response regulator [Candidatus Sulfobium sp.]
MNTGKLLVIDDESIVRTSCKRVLSPEGYEVRLAANAFEGIKMMEEEQFDVVLTDLKMPDMDGITVLETIKKRWPETQVIVITGYQTVDTAVKSIKLGAFDYIEKPFTPDALLSAVAAALGNKKG